MGIYGQDILFLLLTVQDLFDGFDDILLITRILNQIFAATLDNPYDLVQLRSLALTLRLHMPINRNTPFQAFNETILCRFDPFSIDILLGRVTDLIDLLKGGWAHNFRLRFSLKFEQIIADDILSLGAIRFHKGSL